MSIEAQQVAGSSKASMRLLRKNNRDIWLLEGALDYKLDYDLLLKVVKKFELIDCVPTGYHYPEFYASSVDRM